MNEKNSRVTATVPFTAIVNSIPETRASVSGTELTEYVFDNGDKLYVEYKDGDDYKVYGVLDLVEGEGTCSAKFNGELNCLNGFSLDGSVNLSATLVGSSAANGFFSFSDLDEDGVNDVVNRVTYPAEIPGNYTLAEYVQKYSYFTGASTYGARRFTLEQQSVFLNFELFYFHKNDPTATTGTVFLYADNGHSSPDLSSLRLQINNVPIGSGAYGNAIFTTVVPAGNALAGAHILIDDDTTDSNAALEFTPTIANQTLVVNNYYSIARSLFDGFRIKSTVENTTIRFNYYADSDGIQYSRDGGKHWTAYTSQDNIVLESIGDEICVIGNRTNYKNEKSLDTWWTPEDKPIFWASSKCYIYGNIMSLLQDKENLVESAFQGAFSRGSSTAVDYIDIHPDYPLYLPATTLATRCYMQMFRNCTSLTHAPTFRAESVAEKCCYNMFRQCSSLVDVSTIELPATTVAIDCYRELFRQCSNLASPAPELPAPTLVKECYRQMFANTKITSLVCLATDISAENCTNEWMAGVSNNDSCIFYKASTMNSWERNSSGIPNKWKVMDYVAPTP